jgi:hypothetical protein
MKPSQKQSQSDVTAVPQLGLEVDPGRRRLCAEHWIQKRGGNRTMRRWSTFTLLILVVLTCSAQDSTQTHSRWEFLIEPYLMFPNMKGTVGIGTLPDGEVDAGINDIFSRLQSGFMLYAEAQNGTWAVSSDFLYMKLKQDAEPSRAIHSGSVSVSESAWELAGLRKFLPWLEGGIAGRLVSINVDMEVIRNEVGGFTTAQSKSMTQTWFDPVLVVRMKLPDAGRWLLQLRGDVGGFGVGSDLTWQIQAYGGYRFSDLFQVTAGYRALSIDYKKGTEQDRFLYNVTTFGPVLQIGFNF